MSSLPILIAGGGPVGVIAALALARQGVPVQVFEAEDRVDDAPRAAENCGGVNRRGQQRRLRVL